MNTTTRINPIQIIVFAVSCAFLLAALLLSGCDLDTGDDTFVEPLVPGTCSPAPTPEATVIATGGGVLEATDTTVGAISWSWTLPTCSPDRSSRATFTATCGVGDTINWRLSVSNETCTAYTSGSVVVE